MALKVLKPIMPDDFVLQAQTEQKLHAVLSGMINFPANGISGLLLYGVYGTGKTTMANLLPGWIETAKTSKFLATNPVGKLVDLNDTSFNFSCSQTMFEFNLQGIRKGNYTVKITNPIGNCISTSDIDGVILSGIKGLSNIIEKLDNLNEVNQLKLNCKKLKLRQIQMDLLKKLRLLKQLLLQGQNQHHYLSLNHLNLLFKKFIDVFQIHHF